MLTFYRVDFSPGDNELIESLDSYLAVSGRQKANYDTAQYVKHGLEINIKIDINSLTNIQIDKLTIDKIGNYVKVLNSGDTKPVYYFITNSRWISAKGLELHLSMDTVNSYWNDITFRDNCHIIRRFKDRFDSANYSITGSTARFRNKVDDVDETLSVPVINRTSNIDVVEPGLASYVKWYLVAWKKQVKTVVDNVEKVVYEYLTWGLFPDKRARVTVWSHDNNVWTVYDIAPYDRVFLGNTFIHRVIECPCLPVKMEFEGTATSGGETVYRFTANVQPNPDKTLYVSTAIENEFGNPNYVNILNVLYIGDSKKSKASYINNSAFSSTLLPYTYTEITPFNKANLNSAFDSNHDYNFETKLFSSPFYTVKFAYDNSQIMVPYEKLLSSAFDSDQKVTLTVESALSLNVIGGGAFHVSEYWTPQSDNEFFLQYNRTNAVQLYNSEFNNYQSYIAEYDKKANDIAKSQATWGMIGNIGKSVVGGAVGATVGFMKGGGAIAGGVGALVGAGLSVAQSIASTVDSFSSIDNAQAAKEKNLQLQKMGETPSDIGLHNYVTGGKLRFITYEPNENVKQGLAYYWHMRGYAENLRGNPKNYISNRNNFDFVQTDEVYFDENTNSPYSAYEADISARLNIGLYVIHNVNGNWDTAKVSNNFEASVYALASE